ncbi:MAG: threonylcarbamoyl-AMP synthase [Candidatus Aenigmarchaeota archaeon]|nr:threonylcarbamoyl-AMP synthase [Candidatus Aenigmarchaeota archaeon]
MQIVTVDKNNPDKQVLSRAAKIIKDGGLVIYPTDTAYAVGADLTNIDALHKLNSAKMRPDEKNYTAIVADIDMAERFCHLNQSETKLVNKFMPGPLTLATLKKDNVPDKIHKTYFTFRIPDCVIAKEIAQLSDTAITATSANISGERTAYSIDEISPALKGKVDLILDAGTLEKKKVSTICKVENNKVIMLREGAVPEKEINAIL